ncbi:hypothetical protein CASFOL_040235 [Castilleja foliolosa]|uniref:Uncharacterized protein n=1 Tax=Castilleja foliolosa TaxID=1961234 RepID=A0ABD3BFW3_9LAMI
MRHNDEEDHWAVIESNGLYYMKEMIPHGSSGIID